MDIRARGKGRSTEAIAPNSGVVVGDVTVRSTRIVMLEAHDAGWRFRASAGVQIILIIKCYTVHEVGKSRCKSVCKGDMRATESR